jgi:cytochrome c oxidase assembly protein subunit 15
MPGTTTAKVPGDGAYHGRVNQPVGTAGATASRPASTTRPAADPGPAASPGRPGPGAALGRLLPGAALASLVGNVVIVVTGGAVRLTGSGLGCPTWPRCVASSYVPTRAMGHHGLIEFGNRTLFFMVGVLAVAALAAAAARRPRRRDQVTLAALVLAGIPAQAVLGGLTVLTKLNPWLVASHFLLSIAVITPAYLLWHTTRTTEGAPAAADPATAVAGPLRAIAALVGAVSAVVLMVGTVVTGSGPHAGDAHARRTGLDPGMVAQLHADGVMLLVGLSIALWLALRATGAGRPAVRAAGALVVVELAQVAIGFVQYFTHLPVLLVGLHMAGACLVWVATLAVLVRTLPARASG